MAVRIDLVLFCLNLILSVTAVVWTIYNINHPHIPAPRWMKDDES